MWFTSPKTGWFKVQTPSNLGSPILTREPYCGTAGARPTVDLTSILLAKGLHQKVRLRESGEQTWINSPVPAVDSVTQTWKDDSNFSMGDVLLAGD